MMKAVRGQDWGASLETLLYTYKSFVRPVMDYSCVVFAHCDDETIYAKLRSIEVKMIKTAFRLAPWMPNDICYSHINFEDIVTRLKRLSINFINKNRGQDDLTREIVCAADREDVPNTLVRKILRAQ